MWNLITLDGIFEGEKSWDVRWHQRALGPEFHQFAIEQLKTAEMLLFGRVTYEGMAAFWSTEKNEIAGYMNNLPKVVFSRTLDKAEWQNTRLIKEAVNAVRKLKEEGDGNLFVFGSADLSASLMAAGLFDEYRIGLTSIILGKGRPLFPTGIPGMNLKLVQTRPLTQGCVVLYYRPDK